MDEQEIPTLPEINHASSDDVKSVLHDYMLTIARAIYQTAKTMSELEPTALEHAMEKHNLSYHDSDRLLLLYGYKHAYIRTAELVQKAMDELYEACIVQNGLAQKVENKFEVKGDE